MFQNNVKTLTKSHFLVLFKKTKKASLGLKKEKPVKIWFIFEPKFRPKPKFQILPKPKVELKFWSQFQLEPERNQNFGR